MLGRASLCSNGSRQVKGRQMTDAEPIGRKCTQCGEWKDYKHFSWRSDRPNKRLTSRCHECRQKNHHENPETARIKANEYYHNNRDVCLERDKKRRWRNPARCLLLGARWRAKKYRLKFNLTEKDIVIPLFCPILGIPLRMGEGKCHSNSPTLDRIDSRKGYVRGNVIVISFRANTIKNDATLEELKMVWKFYHQLADKLKAKP